MADRTCDKCGKVFKYPAHLRTHKAGVRSCVAVETANPAQQMHKCQHCDRPFMSHHSMMRHIRQSCKMVDVDIETKQQHTAQRQMAIQTVKMETQSAEVRAEIKVLTDLVRLLVTHTGVDANVGVVARAAVDAAPVAARAPAAGVVNNIQNNVNAPTITTNITIQAAAAVNITPWDSPDYITVSLADILAAFAENPKLRQYLHMDDFELSDFEKAPPYVIELFIELLLRAHLLEVARNIYLNPSRADQVMVRMKTGSWDVAPLNDSIEHLFNGIARRLHMITITNEERTKLPYDIQNAISICEMMYKDHPDVYIKLAKEVIVAHLTNCRAKLIESGAVVAPKSQKTRKTT